MYLYLTLFLVVLLLNFSFVLLVVYLFTLYLTGMAHMRPSIIIYVSIMIIVSLLISYLY